MKKIKLFAAAFLSVATVAAQKQSTLMDAAIMEATARYWAKELMNFGSLPNNVFYPQQVLQNADYIVQLLKSRGFKATLWPTPSGKPYVFASLVTDPALPTLLFYSHYDGVPADTAHWNSDPFQPVIKNGQGHLTSLEKALELPAEHRIYGRSVADSKNAMISILAALDLIEKSGSTPGVNIKLLLDGEEELESPYLRDVVLQHATELKADLVVSASGETHQSGLPTIAFGVRGILVLDLTLYTAAADMHSGHFGNFTPNAALELARVLASLKDRAGNVLVPHFYDAVPPSTIAEKAAMEAVPPIEKMIQQQFGIRHPETKASLQQMINRPSLNIRGIQAGYVGERASNIIPATAAASLDIRLVAGMDPEQVYQSILAHLRQQHVHLVAHTPTASELYTMGTCLQVQKKGAFKATKTDMQLPIAQRVLRAAQQSTNEPWVVEPSEGGSLNFSVFSELGMPLITLPVSNFDCNQHTHNENLRLDFFLRGISIFAHLLAL